VCFDKDKGKDGISIETIVARVPRTTLMLQYGIPEFQNVDEFLSQVASKFGQIKKGGLPNVAAAEQKIIHDWHM
jgi:nuclear GTP-binding protein